MEVGEEETVCSIIFLGYMATEVWLRERRDEVDVKLRRYLLALLTGVLALGLMPAASSGQESGHRYEHLEPGRLADLDERVPVNFVFVGYERDDVNAGRFLAGLPREYKPVVRSRLFYNESLERSLLGLNYTYDYNVRFADSDYEERLFGFLSRSARPAPLSDFQKLYNGNDEKFCDDPPDLTPGTPGNPAMCQKNGVRDVKNNHHIDAPSVERWLARNAPAGVDTERNTVFFINWWGDGTKPREGFKHHVYTKTNEPDPDTGFDFGEKRDSRKLIAWGGTTADDEESGLGSTRRIWFHDLSAGPDSFTDNWNVDDPDLTGDGKEDYRLPPIWEYYAAEGYRDESKLTGDLSKVSRYVAINLLFTSSPLFPPQYTPRLLPSRINLDIDTVEGLPGVNASRRYLTPSLVLDEIGELHRLPYSMDQQDVAYEGKARSCYRLFTGLPSPLQCYIRYSSYPAFANLFLYGANNLDFLLGKDQRREYQASLINYAVEDRENPLAPAGLLGFADDNWRNGTQSFTFSFVSPSIAEAGFGLSTTEIHEYGHHLNLSHPHDGFDYEDALALRAAGRSPLGAEYFPDGPFYFAWAGDENNSTMSYMNLNWDFSQFDRDNTNRFQAAGYINNANILAERILASPRAGRAQADLAAADRFYGLAKAAIARHDYVTTFDNARRAYESALSGARKAGLQVEASEDGRTAVPGLRASSQIPDDRIDRPDIPAAKSAQSIEPGQPEYYFTPLAHRLRW